MQGNVAITTMTVSLTTIRTSLQLHKSHLTHHTQNPTETNFNMTRPPKPATVIYNFDVFITQLQASLINTRDISMISLNHPLQAYPHHYNPISLIQHPIESN